MPDVRDAPPRRRESPAPTAAGTPPDSSSNCLMRSLRRVSRGSVIVQSARPCARAIVVHQAHTTQLHRSKKTSGRIGFVKPAQGSAATQIQVCDVPEACIAQGSIGCLQNRTRTLRTPLHLPCPGAQQSIQTGRNRPLRSRKTQIARRTRKTIRLPHRRESPAPTAAETPPAIA